MKINFLVVVLSGWTIIGAAVGELGQPLNKTETLQQTNFTDRPWKVKTLSALPAIDWDLDGKVETDILSKLEDCQRDDLLILARNGAVLRDAGKRLCEDEDPGKRETGSWTYDAATKRLTVKEDDRPQVYRVVENTTGKLVLVYQWKTPKGKFHEITAVYVL